NCRLPLEAGLLTVQGKLHLVGQSPDTELRLFASKIPASSVIRAALHAKSTLPDDLSGDGFIDGTWSIERIGGAPAKWSGALTASRVVLQSRVLDSSLAFPRVVSLNFTSPLSVLPKSRHKVIAQPTGSQAVLEPVTFDLGGKTQLSAEFNAHAYRVE